MSCEQLAVSCLKTIKKSNCEETVLILGCHSSQAFFFHIVLVLVPPSISPLFLPPITLPYRHYKPGKRERERKDARGIQPITEWLKLS